MPYLDNTDSQDLTFAGDIISLSGDPDGTQIDLMPYLDNTDAQILTLSDATGNNRSITIDNGNEISFSVDDGDSSDSNEHNTDFAIVGDQLRISDGGGDRDISLTDLTDVAHDAPSYPASAGDNTVNNNVFFGDDSGVSNNGSNNTFVGSASGNANNSGDHNTFVGRQSGYSNNSGSSNTFVGRQSGFGNQNGTANVFIGDRAGHDNTGSGNVFIGNRAGELETGSNLLYIANDNTATPLIWGDFSAAMLSFNGAATFEGAITLNDMATTRNLVPNMDNSYHLGTAGQAYGDIWFDGSLYIEDNEFLHNRNNNIAIGSNSLLNAQLPDGSNIGIGNNSLVLNINGSYNVAIGNNAMQNNDNGQNNVAIGSNTLQINSSGDYNVAIGVSALQNNTGGTNTAIGYAALYHNEATGNTALGSQALYANTAATGNTAIGTRAMADNNDGESNTAIGREAMENNISGSNNVALGDRAGYSSEGSGNVFIGHRAGYSETGSDKLYIDNSNTAEPLIFGDFATNELQLNGKVIVQDLEPEDGNAWLGSASSVFQRIYAGTLYLDNAINFFNGVTYDEFLHNRSQSIALGAGALGNKMNTGSDNIAIGADTMIANTTGGSNTAVGNNAMNANTIGSNNTAIGNNALAANTTANNNVAVGSGALLANTGVNNVAVGVDALVNNIGGQRNVAIGNFSGPVSDALQRTVAIGFQAETGADNTVSVGRQASAFGGYSTVIGYQAGTTADHATAVGSDAQATGLNSTAIGNGAIVNADNEMTLGNAAVTAINAYVPGLTDISDGRFKIAVREDVSGLEFIKGLRPVSYRLNRAGVHKFLTGEEASQAHPDKRSIGFVAQEVEQLIEKHNYVFTGLKRPQNEDDHYGLRYAEFVVPLTKAVQELSALVEAQQQLIEAQQQELETVKNMLSGDSQVSQPDFQTKTAPGFMLYQNVPNPFNEITLIRAIGTGRYKTGENYRL